MGLAEIAKIRDFHFFLATFSAARGCESDSSTPQAPPEAKVIKGRRPHSPAGGGEICHLWVQIGHFPYIVEGLIADSKNQKDAHFENAFDRHRVIGVWIAVGNRQYQ